MSLQKGREGLVNNYWRVDKMGEFEKALGLLNQYIEMGDAHNAKKFVKEVKSLLKEGFSHVLNEVTVIERNLDALKHDLKTYKKIKDTPAGMEFQQGMLEKCSHSFKALQKLRNAAHNL